MNLRVIVAEPNKEPEVREITNTLEAVTDLIGEYIEVVSLDHRYQMVLPKYKAQEDSTVFFTRVEVEGDFVSLEDEDIAYIKQNFLGRVNHAAI
jgi:hypothetical protein